MTTDETASKAEPRRYLWSNSDGRTDPTCEVFLVESNGLTGLGIQYNGYVIVKAPEEWHNSNRRAAPSDMAVREALEELLVVVDVLKPQATPESEAYAIIKRRLEAVTDRARQALAGAGEVVETDELVERLGKLETRLRANCPQSSHWTNGAAADIRAAIRAMLSAAPSGTGE